MENKIPAKEVKHDVYNFPFNPYDIQKSLMKVAYEVFEESKFALLESPTGTGKSLSLICSSLTWLKDHQKSIKDALKAGIDELTLKMEKLKEEEEQSDDWLGAQSRRQTVSKELTELRGRLEKLEKFEQRKEARQHSKYHHKPLENYEAMLNQKDKQPRTSKGDEGILVGDESVLEEEPELDMETKIKDLYEEERVVPKIYFASRTHSQLSQFISEIKKTRFADEQDDLLVTMTPLASRAHLCVNPDVVKLRDASAINEKCTELQRESSAKKRCPCLRAKQVAELKEFILGSVHDIEDIVGRGRSLAACPYYATRMATAEAEMIVLPYNNLLHHETRKASSLDLRDSVVIIDEAHNILETICSIHSATITGHQLVGSHTILSRYYQRFHNRMAPRNAAMIKVIVECITALIRYLNSPKQHHSDFDELKAVVIDPEDEVVPQNESAPQKGTRVPESEEYTTAIDRFIGVARLEQYNVFKIIDYFDRSQLARKLQGLYKQDPSIDLNLNLAGISARDGTPVKKGSSTSPKKKRRKLDNVQTVNASEKCNRATDESTSLSFIGKLDPIVKQKETILSSYPVYPLVELLKALTNHSQDGKILTNRVQNNIQQSSLKFILLNPSSQFQQMTKEARSIVLAGGTMQPFEEFRDLLFAPLKIDPGKLKTFSCGHVISPRQLFVASLAHGSSGKPLELSYKCRSQDTLDEIGRTLMLIAGAVPGGMVCFLPSYDYEKSCFNRWTQSGVISNIESKFKQVFREPKLAQHMKPVLDEYSRVVSKSEKTGRGALLMCVVGGKMSEGINFNDDLGRCVVMVGLPYANIKSNELRQKMTYYDQVCPKTSGCAGQQYYENLCIKGINQSIGRAIRHKEDYASIILLDRRYLSKTNVRDGLPGWMRQSLVDFERFGPMFNQLKEFFSKVHDRS